MKKEPIVMAIANQKGGVGKTTTTVNLGIGLAKEGNKVLMIDFDPQGDMTTCLGVKQADEIENTITKLMFDSVKTGKADCQSALMHHEEGVDFIPSNIDLADFEMQMISVFNRESILKNTINEIKKGYDYVLIDCPPSLSMLSINALAASNEVLIPVQAQYLPAKGMTKLMETIKRVQQQINRDLKITGVAMTMAQQNTNIAKSTIEFIRENYGRHIKVFDSVIPYGVKSSESQLQGASLYAISNNSKVAKAYAGLSKEVSKQHKPKIKDIHER